MSEVLHGGRLDSAIRRHGGTREAWLDLSTGINPRSYPVGSLPAEVWQALPDTKAMDRLLGAARRYYGCDQTVEITAANGSQAIIQTLPRILNAGRIAIVEPTYGEHRHCWAQAAREVTAIPEPEMAVGHSDILVVGNPNNPNGRIHEPAFLRDLSEELDQHGGILVVDEAFCDLKPELSLAGQLPGNAIVLRSFGKFFGLAGLRLGFALCNADLTSLLRSELGPWNVSGPALEIGAQALSDTEWCDDNRKWISERCQQMCKVLAECALEVSGIGGLFLEVYHEGAQSIHDSLLADKILVRPFPERPGFLRFGLCSDQAEVERLRTALTRAVAGIG